MRDPQWDILELLSINGSQTGVSAARGPIPDTPAWRLRAVYDNIQIEPAIVPKIASTLHDEVTFYFVYKQHKKTLGSLLSINLPGRIKPWLQICSTGIGSRLSALCPLTFTFLGSIQLGFGCTKPEIPQSPVSVSL
ncbi:uncharacterized protein LOC119595641 [Penaeus monodon]|uniref:uncharacterized protein LOC119595641 n=1 Tax=Penaeus monodon TaxID=6687 RepID=UPI0018A71C90|nr:uncharacterized protein LOC119595641 [Penaeus monodon]